MRSKNTKLYSCLLILIFLGLTISSSAQLILQRCDVNNRWEGSNTISVDQNDKKEGLASIQFTGSGTDWFKKKFSQTDVGIDETGWFSFWLFISDVDKLNGDGQIELTSSGVSDVDEYSWPISSLELKDGWNHIKLQLSTANKIGTPSLKSIRFFRIYQVLSDKITVKLDFLRFTKTENVEYSNNPLDISKIDFTTLDGKVMFGYQGWFSHPDDGSRMAKWRHWGTMQDENSLDVEMYPDMREHEPDEMYETGLTFKDDRMARIYSAYNKKTVMRHMKWLRDYNLDGVFLQRFNTSLRDLKLREVRDTVTMNIMNGCEKYERAFVNMWDLSGLSAGCADELIEDWKHLVNDLKITKSPSYLHHRGKPLVAIWGFTVRDELPMADLVKMIEFFKNSPEEKYRATIMLGTNHDFFKKTSWADQLKRVDVISPWAVGRFGDANGNANFIRDYVKPGQDWCDENNIDFLPGVWPGFSWFNLKGEGAWQKNQHKRNGGNFFWTQTNRTISSNAKSVYIAMFDEVDEATAMFKIAKNAEQSPAQGYWLSLDADGYKLPSDWYLRCAKLATEVVKGETENRLDLGTPPDGIDEYKAIATHTKCGTTKGKFTFTYPELSADDLVEFSIDGGNTYPYKSTTGANSIETGELNGGVYNIWLRRIDGSFPTDLGAHTIFNVNPEASVKVINTTCGYADGQLAFTVSDNPYLGPVQFSTDGGNNFPITTTDGTWTYNSHDYAAGNYAVWARWADGACKSKLKDVTIGKDLIQINLLPQVDGKPVELDGTVIRVCQGSSLSISAEPAKDNWTWKWSGANNFNESSRSVLISDKISAANFGKYEISYSDVSGECKNNFSFFIRAESNCTGVGVDAINSNSNCKVYPNPTSNILFFENEEFGMRSISIKDALGRTITTLNSFGSNKLSIDISSYENGIYFYKVEDNNGGFQVGTIVKNS